jgi:predicted dehydrogenase
MVAGGDLGEIRIVEGEFAGGAPALAREPTDSRERHWRYRPDEMGRGAILGEVGTHLHHMVSYVTGLKVVRVAARLDILAERREVYDNAYLSVDFENGAIGRLWNSYQAVGSRHGLRWRIYGTEASLSWDHESPEVLIHRPLGGPAIEIARASADLAPVALEACRFSVGHSEGYGLAFANIYRDFANVLLADALGESGAAYELAKLPGASDGLRTLELIDAALRSHEAGGEAVTL